MKALKIGLSALLIGLTVSPGAIAETKLGSSDLTPILDAQPISPPVQSPPVQNQPDTTNCKNDFVQDGDTYEKVKARTPKGQKKICPLFQPQTTLANVLKPDNKPFVLPYGHGLSQESGYAYFTFHISDKDILKGKEKITIIIKDEKESDYFEKYTFTVTEIVEYNRKIYDDLNRHSRQPIDFNTIKGYNIPIINTKKIADRFYIYSPDFAGQIEAITLKTYVPPCTLSFPSETKYKAPQKITLPTKPQKYDYADRQII